MKLIMVDNFNRETRNDILIAERLSDVWAEKIAALLNEKLGGEHMPEFFRAVPDSYVLYTFTP